MTTLNASPSAKGKRVKFTQQAIENIKEFVAQGISRDEIANRLRVIILPNGSGAPHGQCQDCARGRTEESIAAGSLRGACGQVRDNDATPRQRATH